jgi:hypothetical protein
LKLLGFLGKGVSKMEDKSQTTAAPVIPQVEVEPATRKGYRKSNLLDLAPVTNVQELAVVGNTVLGFENRASQDALPYWVAFGKAGYRIISEKTDYNQNNLISDLRESGCKLGDSTIKHTLRAGKLLGDSDTRHFPLGINTHEVVKLLAVFGKIRPYQWKGAYELYKKESLDNTALLARFGIVKAKKTEAEKDSKATLNETAKANYLAVIVKRFKDEEISLDSIVVALEKTFGVGIIANRINPEDTAKQAVIADREKRQAIWLAGQAGEVFVNPRSGAVTIWQPEADIELPAESIAIEATKVAQNGALRRKLEAEALAEKKSKRQGK